MSTKPLRLVSGVDSQEYVTDNLSAGLTAENSSLRAEVARLETELRDIKRSYQILGHAVKSLQQQLKPMYQSLRMLFGEIDSLGIDGNGGNDSSNASKWNAIKERLPQRHRDAIDVLLLQGSMKRKNLASAIRMDYKNCVNNVVGPLIRQGWVVDVGGDLRLKQL